MSNYPSYQPSPQSLANLRLWRPGESGNPGGNFNHSPKLSNAYAKLMRMDDATYAAYVPGNKAEKVAKKVLDLAEKSEELTELISALKEIADRTEGKPLQTKVVEHTVSGETKSAIIIEAYTALFYNRTREESLSAINAIHDAIEANRDKVEVRQLVEVAVQEDEQAISGLWQSAEEAVMGSNGVR